MSRAVVGASAFVPVIVCCFVIVLLHRLLGWLIARNSPLVSWVEGEKIPLFRGGRFDEDRMKRALVCREDVMQGVRKSALTEDLEKIDKVYMERNGDISAIKNDTYGMAYRMFRVLLSSLEKNFLPRGAGAKALV
ncbi:YetF domain-containing protein [Mucilaginibacter sp. UC70_90]